MFSNIKKKNLCSEVHFILESIFLNKNIFLKHILNNDHLKNLRAEW